MCEVVTYWFLSSIPLISTRLTSVSGVVICHFVGFADALDRQDRSIRAHLSIFEQDESTSNSAIRSDWTADREF